MSRYVIETTELVSSTWSLDAESPEDAWAGLLSGRAQCVDRSGHELAGTFDQANIQEEP